LRWTRRGVRPMKPGDPFGDVMNAPKKYVVSKTLKEPTWRNTTIIRDNPIEAVRKLKAESGKNIVTDGSSQLVHALLQHDLVDELFLHVYPIALGKGKRVPRSHRCEIHPRFGPSLSDGRYRAEVHEVI